MDGLRVKREGGGEYMLDGQGNKRSGANRVLVGEEKAGRSN